MRSPHPVDAHVGKKLRLARLSLGKSQREMAMYAGISFQQVQKYEKGANRISASRLFEFSRLLGVEVAYFFQGIVTADEQSSEHDCSTDLLKTNLAGHLFRMDDHQLDPGHERLAYRPRKPDE